MNNCIYCKESLPYTLHKIKYHNKCVFNPGTYIYRDEIRKKINRILRKFPNIILL